jgi:hypothetical protein
MMTIFLRVLGITILLIFWFFVSGVICGQVFTIEKIYWLAGKFGIHGDEAVYDLAATIGLSFAALSSVVLTFFSWKYISRKK